MKFTESLWVSIGHIYDKILKHPFIQGLTDGSLDEEAFRFYVIQDALYLKDFGPSPWGTPQGEFDLNRDPGAPWILLFSVLFTVANLLYLLPARKGEGADAAEDPASARSRRRGDSGEGEDGASPGPRPEGEDDIAARGGEGVAS